MNDTALATQQENRDLAPARTELPEVVFTPRFDIVQTEDEMILCGDLPGVKPEDLDVSFERGTLSIHGKCGLRPRTGKLLAREYQVGDFQRTFTIREPVDVNAISAEIRNGILTVKLPRSEVAKPRRISVKASE